MARVLVVDDQKVSRVTLAALLEEAGHVVSTAESGVEGLGRAAEWGPDVIVLDVQMPEMDGFAVVERLKQNPDTAPIPVVFLTAEPPTDELIVRGLDLGAYDFLGKGGSKAELLARVGVMARIKRGHDELAAIARVSDTLVRTIDPVSLARLFVEQAREVFRGAAALLRLQRSDDHKELRAAVGVDSEDPLVDTLLDALLENLELPGEESGVIPLTSLTGPAGALVREHGWAAALVAGVHRSDRRPAVVAVLSEAADAFQERADPALLHLLLGQATIAIDNALLHLQARTQAEELERAMSERSRFFASMSHELRTPINAVIGYNQLLEEGVYGGLSEPQQRAVEKVGRSAQHLLELINDVLDISKIEAGKIEIIPEVLELTDLLRDTLTSVQLQAEEKGLRLRLDAPEQLRVETDSARVRQIILNLLSNAVKFTDQGEVALLAEQRGGGAAGDRDVSGAQPPEGGILEGGWVVVRVRDSGPGIPPEERERIFNEFEQAEGSSSRGGTGLGLAISRRLARLLGGELTVQSEVGRGSTFTLRLPARAPARDLLMENPIEPEPA